MARCHAWGSRKGMSRVTWSRSLGQRMVYDLPQTLAQQFGGKNRKCAPLACMAATQWERRTRFQLHGGGVVESHDGAVALSPSPVYLQTRPIYSPIRHAYCKDTLCVGGYASPSSGPWPARIISSRVSAPRARNGCSRSRPYESNISNLPGCVGEPD